MQSTFCYKMFLHLPIKTPYPRKINYMFKLLLSLVHKKREKIIFILFVLLGIMSTLIFISLEAYSAAGETWFGWWLVEHYFSYHVNCPDGCGLGEPVRGG